MIKQVVIIGCLTAAGAAEAHQLKPARLAPSPFADTEVSTNVTCNLNLPSLKMYRLALGLVATPSNEVEVVIGAEVEAAELVQEGKRTVNGIEHDAPFYHVSKSTLREVSVVEMRQSEAEGRASGRAATRCIALRSMDNA